MSSCLVLSDLKVMLSSVMLTIMGPLGARLYLSLPSELRDEFVEHLSQT